MNQVEDNQPPIGRPLLVRSSNKLCEDCGLIHTSLNTHQYCHECAGNNVDDNDDRMIRDNIIRYHLNTTFRNEEGIRRFSRNEEEDSEAETDMSELTEDESGSEFETDDDEDSSKSAKKSAN